MREVALTQSQMGVYLECIGKEGQLCYNLPYLYVFDHSLDSECFCRAVETALQAHPTVFTRLRLNDEGIPMQHIEEEPLTLTVERIEDRDFTRYVKPFQLVGGRLFNIHLLEDEEHYYLFWDCHHIVNDGSSLHVLLHDINAAYSGEALEPEVMTLADYAAQEQTRRTPEVREAGRQWYAAHFDCEDVVNGLMPDGEHKSDTAGHTERALDVDLQRVEQFCRDNAIYKSTLMTTAYAYLLARYAGEQASLTRTAYTGRADKRLSRTQGMFVKTMPIYCQFDDDTTVLDLLRSQQEQMKGCREHEDYSYMDLVNDMQFAANSSFVWHGEIFSDTELMGSPMKTVELGIEKTEGDRLYVKTYILDGQIWLRVEFDSEYSQALMEEFTDSYEAVVNGMLNQERLREITITNERQLALLDSFNQTDMPIDETETVVGVFRSFVAKQPDKVAVVFKDRQYTYREVDELSDRLAAYIISKGLQAEDVVSIIVPRCEWMAIASLGVLKAGCAYQPLDPTYPKERLAFMMQDADAKMLIADEDLRHIVSDYHGEVLLTKDIATVPCGSPHPSTLTPHPSSLFILLYTSGSTGTPKGVMLEHRNVMAFCRMHQKKSILDSESRVGAYASFGFDASLMELWGPLSIGSTIYIIPEEMRLDLITLNEYFEANRITHTFMTTQVARQFVNDIENHSLIAFITGGEKLADINPPSYLLLNGYGPSESICYVTAFPVREKLQNIPIGKAVTNMHLYVMDRYGHRQPVGATGELWVNGPQVARGYLNQPEKTAAAFVETAFGRCYRTGDIVRYLPDGNIQFVGRRDGQVKIRGFRIELKEVEGIIRQYPGIKDVTVQAFDQEGGGKFIAAYIISDSQVDIQALNAFIMEEKPPYMVPAVTMQIDSIPLNQNQKVDKRALPKPEKSALTDTEQAANAPLNVLEEELKQIIASVIHNEDFGLTTILGFAGLTSIMAIQLAVKINKRFGVALNSKALVKSGTLQSIENEILQSLLHAEDRASTEFRHVRKQNPSRAETNSAADGTSAESVSFPLSYSQTGVYVDCVKQPLSTIYNIPTKIAFPKGTDTARLEEAVKALVNAHPQLSAYFDIKDGNVVQTVRHGMPVEVSTIKMSEAELESYKQEFVRPFNLNKGPLYRFEIVETEERVYLLMDVHHLVADGASIDLMFRQICGAMDGTPIEAEDYTYYRYVKDQKAAEDGAEYAAAKEYFHQQLSECEEVTEIPADLTNPLKQGDTGTVSCPFDLQAVEAFCREHQLTPAHLTLAAVFYTLSCYANSERVTLTTISNGRADVRTADTVGMFVNTLVLSMKVNDRPVSDFLRSVSEQFDATLSHENYPFAQIAADYDLKADIMFAYQVGVLNRYTVGGKQLEVESLELNVPKFRMAFYIQEVDGAPSVTIDYDNGRYSESLMRSIASAVVTAIKAFMQQPQIGLRKVSLLDDEQTERLDAFNDTDVAYDDTQTVVSLFRRQAALHPDNIAVVYHEKRYTYREVDEISERIAAYIASKGLGCEDVVSILIPRSEWMVIASMGVLKAGCAYQPLDPSYPAERLNFMMQDADARMLIADEDLRPIVSDYHGEVLLTKDIATVPCGSPQGPSLPPLPSSFPPSSCAAISSQHPSSLFPLPSSLFILLYTSGSTGTPKGVMLEHRNLVAFCHWYQRYYDLTPDCHVAAYASYGFDASMMDMYPALTCGAAVYIIGEDIRLNLPELNDYFNANGITHSFITTQVGYQFAVNANNTSLQHFSVGGEKLSALQPPTNYQMHNGYGPTECTIFTTTYQLKDYEMDIPIGKPVDNLKLYIVDRNLNRLPVGALGELWVSGPQVGRGYLNRPDKSAESFIDNPFAAELGDSAMAAKYAHVYRTGDIVRYLPDGNIQFVGRRDGQVKIRGFRIELKEVEAVIRQFPDISDATVQAFDSPTGGKFIAAYVVSSRQVDVKELNDFIGKQKPPYMIPASTMQIDSIPLNQNQKVNRKMLPVPVIQSTNGHYEEPANDMERTLCDIFARVLRQEKVGATDDFFNDLGGTSLNVTLVIVEADKEGLHLAYGDLFSNPTPRQLVSFLSQQQSGAASSSQEQSPKAKEAGSPADGDDGSFDYAPIDELLTHNTLDNFRKGERQTIGRVLLTGATGYLGIHVLKELIDRDDVPEIYCIIRAEDSEKAERRLKQLLFYYYGKNFKELFGTRLHVVLGDVTQDLSSLFAASSSLFPHPSSAATVPCGSPQGSPLIDTVFNCAAVVKHFSAGTEIEDVNIGGAQRCVEFCLKTGARLTHISTYSTAGLSVNGTPSPDIIQTEQTLYYGQYMDNRYVHSKFLAERIVLDAIARQGLNAKVMRVGNLAPRSTDGEFQINAQTNSAMGRVRVFKSLGCYPYEMTDQPMEFSPINEVAHAVVLLSESPRECCLFHPFNNHYVHFGDVMQELRLVGDVPQQVELEDYERAMDEAKSDPQKVKLLHSLIAYQDLAHGQKSTEIKTVNDYTTQVLYRLGFRWTVTSWDYVDRFLTAIDGLGYFSN